MNSDTEYADWIAVDWGTSQLRAWAIRDGQPVAEAQSGDGMGTLAPEQFEASLLALIDPWLGSAVKTVVACGMVGARQGWVEAAYASVPCAPQPKKLTQASTGDPRLSVHVLPGLSQSAPADVMRGEETQIAGYLVQNPGFDGVICLPGTHTKWVQISAGEVVSFRTFMTGEMFALLSKSSVLRHSLSNGWDGAAFEAAVGDAISKPEAMASRFFSLRAESLLNGLSGDAVRARLSGLLVGAELAAARPYWLGQSVALIGDATFSAHYRAALSFQGVDAGLTDATEATLAGLSAAYRMIKDNP